LKERGRREKMRRWRCRRQVKIWRDRGRDKTETLREWVKEL
jgi:hypothetical protein